MAMGDEMIPAIELIFKGIIIGLTVSVPLGPAGIVLVNRTIKRGLLSGFFSGMGVAAADTILAIIAGLGFTVIITFFEDEKVIISIIAGLVIIGAGIKIFVSNPVKEFRKKEKGRKTLPLKPCNGFRICRLLLRSKCKSGRKAASCSLSTGPRHFYRNIGLVGLS
jgi:threonine/homoserine/homoserine lactone efflux protein